MFRASPIRRLKQGLDVDHLSSGAGDLMHRELMETSVVVSDGVADYNAFDVTCECVEGRRDNPLGCEDPDDDQLVATGTTQLNVQIRCIECAEAAFAYPDNIVGGELWKAAFGRLADARPRAPETTPSPRCSIRVAGRGAETMIGAWWDRAQDTTLLAPSMTALRVESSSTSR